MGRRSIWLVISCILASTGCQSRNHPEEGTEAAGPGRAAVGQWSIVAINGKPIAAGSTIGVDYRPDGQLIVESTGTDASSLDRDWLKKMLDQLKGPGVFTTLKMSGGGYEVEMKRKPGTVTIPPD